MVNPLFLIVLALGSAFLLPLIHRIGFRLSRLVFLIALAGMAFIGGFTFYTALNGGDPGIYTAGFQPPVSISLKAGLEESFALAAVLTASLLGGIFLFSASGKKALAGMMIYLALVLGVCGIIMTRDLFNLFVFLEITAISTYGLIALEGDRKALEGGFKYLMAGGLSSIFFLLATIYIYRFTGTLNLDGMIANQSLLSGPGGRVALFFLMVSLIIEVKLFPANGWALDVYEAAPAGIAGVIASANAGAMAFALYKILPLLPPDFLRFLSTLGFLTFFFSNLIALRQESVRRMLGYSSVSQMGLLSAAMSLMFLLGINPLSFILIAGGLFINHLLAKAGLFWLAGRIGRSLCREWAGAVRGGFSVTLMGILVLALSGLPPFPGFWAKWELLRFLIEAGQNHWTLLVLAGSLLEVIYLMRWFILSVRLSDEAGNPAGSDALSAVFPEGIIPAGLLLALGSGMGNLMGGLELPVLLILAGGIAFFLIDFLPLPLKAPTAMAAVAYWGWFFYKDLSGLKLFFFLLFLLGGLVHLFASLYRKDRRTGYYPLMVMTTLSLGALVLAQSSLAFFTAWELMALRFLAPSAERKKSGQSLAPLYCLFHGGSLFPYERSDYDEFRS